MRVTLCSCVIVITGTRRGRPAGTKMKQPTKEELRQAAAAAGAAAVAVAGGSSTLHILTYTCSLTVLHVQ